MNLAPPRELKLAHFRVGTSRYGVGAPSTRWLAVAGVGCPVWHGEKLKK